MLSDNCLTSKPDFLCFGSLTTKNASLPDSSLDDLEESSSKFMDERVDSKWPTRLVIDAL